MAVESGTRRVKDVMTTEPISVTSSMTAGELARLLDANGISGAPVVDALDRVVGVVSKTDLIHQFLEGAPGERASAFFADVFEDELGSVGDTLPEDFGVVEDFMTEDPVTAMPDESVSSVAHRMAESGMHRVIVTDENDYLLGIVTSLDLLRVYPE